MNECRGSIVLSKINDCVPATSMIRCLQLQWLCADRNDCVLIKIHFFFDQHTIISVGTQSLKLQAHSHWFRQHTFIEPCHSFITHCTCLWSPLLFNWRQPRFSCKFPHFHVCIACFSFCLDEQMIKKTCAFGHARPFGRAKGMKPSWLYVELLVTRANIDLSDKGTLMTIPTTSDENEKKAKLLKQ